jgi:hypothetical protein
MHYKAELDVGDEVQVTGARFQPWLWSAGTYKVEERADGKYKLRNNGEGQSHIVCHFHREQLTLVKDARQATHPPTE